MLQSIRNGSRSWGAKIIIGVMVAAMALFGVESLFGLFGDDPNQEISVNGEPIMRQQIELEVQRAMRSGQVPPEQERQLRNDIRDELVTQTLLTQYAEEGGLYVSEDQVDQLIVGIPEFQDEDGRFSPDIFRNRLSGAGYTPLSFREELEVDVKRQQLQQGLAFSDFTLDNERQRLAELQRQQRSFRYVMLDEDDLEGGIEISDDELQTYYEANADRFERPEQVRLEYVLVDRREMANNVDVDEEALREAWLERTEDADRRVSHIMITFGDERNRDEAQQRADEALQALEDGESFADTALRYSDDTASAEEGGDLGTISPGFFGEAFDEAAFSLDEGETSSVVEMDNALHIIQVTDIERPAFEDQRDSLREDVAMNEVNDAFNDKVQQLIDESFAADDLQSVAEDLSLTLEESDWLSRNDQGSSVLFEPGVMEQAFSDDVLEEGYNSEVIELDEDRRLVVRVADHREQTQLPLNDVRDEVEAAVRAKRQQERLQSQAEDMVARLQAGESIDRQWLEANNVRRQDEVTASQLIVQAAFRMPHPDDGESTYQTAVLPTGVAVLALDEVTAGDVDEERERFVAQMAQQLRAQAIIQGLVEDLRSDAEIER
ncbi:MULTISPECIES: SurA N-terminal domain-containing protein [Halomonadaceae]|jgi:peptidyl-prolyl cis-trans isomerase D|uniref:Periplasmic chaperone PpiD n=1 Tax=Vreelandella janggokensis TaxID=370767 RepID=A0ABT4ITI1_9GAMM|nr:SurA N-terminal domain-containing protein [Halomonas janggokensis]MCZ0926302.1 SurA N-terminal domain-containing protein [Halomonas janggokensis]MCZ0928840.1 SurA N-terminal domain-containing protein [Halomonas janggokensis]MDR5885627.1 SurA N-terminal domain-containing protein [Halomonas janggokensis]